MKLSPAQREEVRMMFGGFCAYCGCALPQKGWHADHVESVKRWWVRQYAALSVGRILPRPPIDL
jgi:hypothetical protein